ncbi:putative pectinesterase/pectinesterase inhibitor 36 [Bienertia sinuspersici]
MAGPQKHQAVASMVESDHSLFYRCSFQGYQDTVYVHSLRQFYRDYHIYMTHKTLNLVTRLLCYRIANMITVQGRENPNENIVFSNHGSRIRPAPEFVGINRSQQTFLRRPWKKYSRTIVFKTHIGLIHPVGWTK